jgi:hypothetical protein
MMLVGSREHACQFGERLAQAVVRLPWSVAGRSLHEQTA